MTERHATCRSPESLATIKPASHRRDMDVVEFGEALAKILQSDESRVAQAVRAVYDEALRME
jgi:hypothetical protein